ncbi:hypothetical protein C9374_008766 [Naegleria lovaniensis]|uniref:Importin subunit alpha n=1 Tax=Naegleria lovaniensis TaxID=51637 RepID=A0AA88GEY3_NAELO|nr:uncharacterized protein C9374_008766 [Naegleria lovaniensis]KAG2378144.1 hypothetical protein C9374_008766 [Naegleria lovaniensis]
MSESCCDPTLIADRYSALFSCNDQLRYEALIYFTTLLNDELVPVDDLIELGAISKFVEFLQHDDEPQLQSEAAWALICVTDGTSEHVQYILELGALPWLIRLISSSNEEVQEHAIWTLGNIAGDGLRARDCVLRERVLEPLLKCMENHVNHLGLIRTCSFLLCNLCRCQPVPSLEVISSAIPMLVRLLYHTDEEVVANACVALACLCNPFGPIEYVERVVQTTAVTKLAGLLSHPSKDVVVQALQAIGNIAAGDASHFTQVIIDSGALAPLRTLLSDSLVWIQKKTCWVLSNITCVNEDHVQDVIKANIMLEIIRMIENSTETELKKQAIWVFVHAMNRGNNSQIVYMIEQQSHCIEVLCDIVLQNEKADLAGKALAALSKIVFACREEGACPECEDKIQEKGLWHVVVYNNVKVSTVHTKRFTNLLRRPVTTKLCDMAVSFHSDLNTDDSL